jgi:hypothetical protein
MKPNTKYCLEKRKEGMNLMCALNTSMGISQDHFLQLIYTNKIYFISKIINQYVFKYRLISSYYYYGITLSTQFKDFYVTSVTKDLRQHSQFHSYNSYHYPYPCIPV